MGVLRFAASVNSVEADLLTRGKTLFVQFLAGSALGLLLGLLVGLSSSPVVAAVVGTLTAALMVLLGFSKPDNPDDPNRTSASAWRLSGFGIFGAVALLSGLGIRTHNLFSQPIATQVDDLAASGFTPDEAHAWVAYKNAGLHLRIPEGSFDKTSKLSSNASSVLFADSGSDACTLFDPSQYANSTEQWNAFNLRGPQYAQLVQFGRQLNDQQRTALIQSIKPLLCPGP